jgi:hypothetical protein
MRVKYALVAAALALTAPARGETVAAPTPDLSWLSGAWRSLQGEQSVEERWSPVRGGLMLGTGVTLAGNKAVFFEFLRIERGADGALTYWALPKGAAKATPFKLSEAEKQSATFTNAAHDYPQRIRYWRVGPALHAEIALIDGSKAQSWSYQPIIVNRK